MAEHLNIVEKIKNTAEEFLHVSGVTTMKDFIAGWSSSLSFDEMTKQDKPSYTYSSVCADPKVVPKSILEELFLVTNPADTLYSEGMVPYGAVRLQDVPADNNLQTVKHSAESARLKKQASKYYALIHSSLQNHYCTDEYMAHKYATLKTERNSKKEATAETSELKWVVHPEAIITIHFHRPRSYFGNKPRDFKRGWPTMTLHAIGFNSMVELRDAFKCPKDYEIPGDFSEVPDEAITATTARELMPSALFFIEGVFYIDTRTLKAHDYSKPIVEWLQKKGCTDEFPVKSMRKTKLSSVPLRLGVPYVYIHQGNCEHVIQFTDLRLVHAGDSQVPAAYPLQVSTFVSKFTICNACATRAVKWMVCNSQLSPSDPAHYCDICFKMLHYDLDGKKRCDFKAYRFTDNFFVSAS